MIFTSFDFALFFTLVVLLRLCVRSFAAEKWLLLLASLAFYLSWNAPCVLLICFTSLLDFSIARQLGRVTDPVRRKRLLLASLGVSLGLLAFFKYANFFVENFRVVAGWLGWKFAPVQLKLILPPAISFYTFASLGYVLDVYFERCPPVQTARDYSLFISFFPKLLSGPITRGSELLGQFKERVRASAQDVEIGLAYVLSGAVKKMVLADQVAAHVNLIFANPGQFDGVTLAMGLLGYAAQIYCDFSGYSDMAIGVARIMGFQLPENFQMPFSSCNIAEFWRRWHITLSRWFRDYLFLPLEIATRGNPNPMLRVSLNMIITMLLCGLWHGASWNFVIWGGIHGAALAIHKGWTTWKPTAKWSTKRSYALVAGVGSHVLTLGVVLIAMAFFRTQSLADATAYLGRMFSLTREGTRLDSPYIFGVVAAVVLAHLAVHKDRNLALELPRRSLPARMLAYSALVLLLVLLGATDSSPFAYFQF